MLGKTHSPARKRILILLAWHATDAFRGIAKFAKDAGWVIDSRFDRSGEIPKNWQGDGVIGVLGIHPEVDAFAKKCRVPFVNIGYSLVDDAPRVAADQDLIARLADPISATAGSGNSATISMVASPETSAAAMPSAQRLRNTGRLWRSSTPAPAGQAHPVPASAG